MYEKKKKKQVRPNTTCMPNQNWSVKYKTHASGRKTHASKFHASRQVTVWPYVQPTSSPRCVETEIIQIYRYLLYAKRLESAKHAWCHSCCSPGSTGSNILSFSAYDTKADGIRSSAVSSETVLPIAYSGLPCCIADLLGGSSCLLSSKSGPGFSIRTKVSAMYCHEEIRSLPQVRSYPTVHKW